MSTEVATATSTELAISAEQTDFTPQQVAVLEHLGIKDAPEGDRQLFFHQCKRTGLDPFAKQIYMIGRTKRKKQGNNWVDDGMSYTIQTGIDGYRLNGKRAARREGVSYQVAEPLWRGPNQGDQWDDVWLDPKNPPAAAKVSITVGDSTFTAVALYHEYVQYKMGTEPNSMWSKMPANQLRKCAEAAAWRLAFPDDFSGLVLEDAVQVIDQDGKSVVQQRTGGRGNAAARAALGIGSQPEQKQFEPEQQSPKAEQAAANTDPDAATPDQLKELAALLDKEKLKDAAAKLTWVNSTFHTDYTDPRQMTFEQALGAIDYLKSEQAKDAQK
jgi:phage recombination protein Bet